LRRNPLKQIKSTENIPSEFDANVPLMVHESELVKEKNLEEFS
jgi:hypothetical protein